MKIGNIDAEVFTDDDEDEDDDSEADDDQRYAKLDSVRIEDYPKLYHNDIFEHVFRRSSSICTSG